MAEKYLIVNSAKSLASCVRTLYELWAEHPYLRVYWKVGADRSISQNALLHVWLTEYAAFLLRRPKDTIGPAEMASIKRAAKMHCYEENAWSWLVHEIKDPWHPDKCRLDFTSSKDWTHGEMYEFLTWLQGRAAKDGLLLESKGEYAKEKRRENS